MEDEPEEPPAAQDEEDDADEDGPDPVAEPTPEEIALIEQVRTAERERAGEADDEDGRPGEAARAANSGANGADHDGIAEAEPAGSAPQPAGAAQADPDQALGARLVALQMAVAGGNRGEVESHLRRAFDLDDPEPILDDIFGSGTDSERRVVWPEVG